MLQAESTHAAPFPTPEKALRAAAGLWLVIALVGLWAFVAYIVLSYGATAARGDLPAWGDQSLKGYVRGDLAGNIVFASHLTMAAVMSLGGALQLAPRLRARWPAFHRWNGRAFLAAAFAAAIGGLYLVWVRQATTTRLGAFAISLDAALILAFGILAWRAAWARDFAAHRRWAMRTFMVANGVWFMRLGYMAWVILNGGAVGMTDRLDGPFDIFLAFAAYLVPWAVLELYLRVRGRGGGPAKYALAGGLMAVVALTAVGVFGAMAFMWWPRIAQALAT
jgi:hypothetical protein